jgi:tRNA pseudouridine38-40 synthase
MVRAIVGTLLNLGRNKITLDEFDEIIKTRNRANAGDSVPAHGLFLESVKYPNTIYIH